MFELLERLTTLKDAVRQGSGRVAEVLAKVEAVVAEARRLAEDVEAGKVFAAAPDQHHRLFELQADFEACCDEATGTPPVSVAAGPEPVNAMPPGFWIAVARLAAEIIRNVRERRQGG